VGPDLRQFEPLLPSRPRPALEALAEEVARGGFELRRALHPVTEARIAQLLRSVNSYYSNRIEGEQTLPRDIERALRKSFSKDPAQARLQRLALAHIETQEEMERRLAAEPAPSLFGTEFLASLHRSFYGRLQKQDRVTDAGDEVAPGYFRRRDVTVGAHEAPDWQRVPAFLQRIDEAYSAERSLTGRLVAIACAHHRLAWVHPFRDGNGRVLRLHSQAALLQHGAGSALWSVSRGFARHVRTYYDLLAAADAPRTESDDGPGELSENGLVAFAQFFLETCRDQIAFMAKLVDLTTLRARVTGHLRFLADGDASVRVEAAPALHHAFLAGTVPRGEFKQMTGLPSRTADRAIAALLRRGLLESESPKGPVRIGLPLDALAHYFPNLYPEAAA
jgi:Fic family protein